jgi:hypothetical protein
VIERNYVVSEAAELMASEVTRGGLEQRIVSAVSGDEDRHTGAHEEGEDSDVESPDTRGSSPNFGTKIYVY